MKSLDLILKMLLCALAGLGIYHLAMPIYKEREAAQLEAKSEAELRGKFERLMSEQEEKPRAIFSPIPTLK